MNSLKQLIRLHRWNLDEKRRKLNEFESLRDRMLGDIAEMEQLAERETEIAAQNQEGAMAFPQFISVLLERRRKLTNSLGEVEVAIEEARERLAEAFQEVKRYEIAAENAAKREADKRRLKETTLENELGLESFRRKAGLRG